jgi:starch synthase
MADQSGLNVVMFAAEVSPFAKVGGLADVLGALPKALGKIGARVTVLLPAYKSIDHDQYGIRPSEMVADFDVPMGPGSAYAEVFQTLLPRSSVDVFLIGCDRYFNRDGIYDDPITHEGYLDNMERFVFFMKAGLELLPKLGLKPDIIHCHDSQTGLIPGLLRTSYFEEPFYAGTGTLFTTSHIWAFIPRTPFIGPGSIIAISIQPPLSNFGERSIS